MKPETFKIKINTIAEVEVSEAAYALALSHSDTQAEFLNMFSEELLTGCGSERLFNLQLSEIMKHLDDGGKMLILDLAKFIKIQEDEDNR